ncbi:hypothetical protein GS429_20995 [Natronorubrum sp. JWXQ-INN-674]|uniref:Uncharacterized protein n=1 Tax=Natronorubrum halalkaliphilum TaxID=2691917 RepID=A0A6B0VUU6_9EURY|nr:hypothetical protein [Natronorubrum halalkaliphilum]MXV64502.1 hypothetical protein [Natronorubrum halalkaliphilum]
MSTADNESFDSLYHVRKDSSGQPGSVARDDGMDVPRSAVDSEAGEANGFETLIVD